MKKTIILAALATLFGGSAIAQEKSTIGNGTTNIQIFYDFGKDRKIATTTLEGFYNDPWGNTFFFIDHDFNTKKTQGTEGNKAISGSYMEIARCLNFWQESVSLHCGTPMCPNSRCMKPQM